ncbi:phosphate ABC transporter substrate-binding protein PstS [Microvirga sp. 17 mud 1-3]|uniref:phosphate ABC transporter substrate-binding protein PstS n=1 Tax=Microvirga sp. 17 mud 1-3 TaxID=2082949 RepID=UPI000D6D7C33|nr:phosphate ABC transporter substrate-binding protein PstS [Microvirga sp. 17 mud 1-3]AWM88249.1 phosphate ABC transporter substrate-binding protein PstS [Microvirga sp. 17 mud 1-3]
MKFLSFAFAAGLAASALTTPAAAVDITGAGATFPFPVYAKWAEAYKKETGNGLNYQSIGSGGGIKQIQAKTVDFGATDAPLKGADLDKHGLLQFPTVMGGVVPVVNITSIGSGQLKLTGEVLADIFQGKIAKWSDARIAKLNEGVKLPDAPITPVYRSDASGTTNVFTTYLAQVSKSWEADLGTGTAVSWPVGQGGKGNEGVAATVKQVPNAIGYVEYAYAKQNDIAFALLQNKAGKFPAPGDKSFQAAAANADWTAAPGFGISLTDQAGDDAWPITAPTFILVHKTAEKPEQTAEVLKFFDWAYKSGDKLASDLDYVPLPDNVVKLVEAAWAKEVKDKSGQVVFKQ